MERSINGSSSSSGNDNGSNNALMLTLSVVLSVVGFLILVGAALLCWRHRKHQIPFFGRGISPIDDEEIEAWKRGSRRRSSSEKNPILPLHSRTDDLPHPLAGNSPDSSPMATRNSRRPPPAAILYRDAPPPRTSVEGNSPRSVRSIHSFHHHHHRKQSADVPATAAFAVAPNARPGLCDESVPGDGPFVMPLKRQTSRLTKPPHARSRSSRSSLRSSSARSPGRRGRSNTVSPRTSHDNMYDGMYHPYASTVFRCSPVPPRLSLDDDILVGGLSPPPAVMRNDIGRALG